MKTNLQFMKSGTNDSTWAEKKMSYEKIRVKASMSRIKR